MNTPTATVSQLKGMMNFHRKAYKAYKAINHPNAIPARRFMIDMYLKLRALR